MVSSILHQNEQQLIQQYNSHQVDTTKRILLVNYENDVNFALKFVIERKRSGIQVDSSSNPILALKHFKKQRYNLLIIAVVMPKMNGFDLAKEIRKIDDKVKICFLIAGQIPNKFRNDQDCTQEEQSQDKFIRLPIENDKLITEIEKIMV
jgi:two-component SAPR family response regulator